MRLAWKCPGSNTISFCGPVPSAPCRRRSENRAKQAKAVKEIKRCMEILFCLSSAGIFELAENLAIQNHSHTQQPPGGRSPIAECRKRQRTKSTDSRVHFTGTSRFLCSEVPSCPIQPRSSR